jgi:hypothetical protein
MTIITPLPRASGAAAVRIAFNRLSGPSALIAVVLDREIEKVGGLFERAGPVGNDDASRCGILREDPVDAARDRQPVVERDVRAANVDDLLDLHVRVLRDFRHARDQLRPEHRAGLVFGQRCR